MGRAPIQPPPTTSPPPQINHFSHPHILYPNHNPPQATSCSGCKLQKNGKIAYSCQPCNFTLHQSCADLPKLITHPSHPCSLTLLTLSTYPGGVFSCDACSQIGNGWSYHCTQGCSYDLHITCASKPLKIRHQSHVTCHLDLTFKSPYAGSDAFSCDICSKIGEKQWLYRCHTCGFDVHLHCTNVNMNSAPHQHHQQHNLQHHYSFPTPGATNPVQHHQNSHPLTHSASYPAGQFVNPNYQNVPGQPAYGYVRPGGAQNVTGQPAYGYVRPGGAQSVPGQPAYGYVRPGGAQNMPMQQNTLANNLMSSAMQGLVEGAFQTVGQTVMQDFLGSGGGNGGTGADTGGADMGGADMSGVDMSGADTGGIL